MSIFDVPPHRKPMRRVVECNAAVDAAGRQEREWRRCKRQRLDAISLRLQVCEDLTRLASACGGRASIRRCLPAAEDVSDVQA